MLTDCEHSDEAKDPTLPTFSRQHLVFQICMHTSFSRSNSHNCLFYFAPLNAIKKDGIEISTIQAKQIWASVPPSSMATLTKAGWSMRVGWVMDVGRDAVAKRSVASRAPIPRSHESEGTRQRHL